MSKEIFQCDSIAALLPRYTSEGDITTIISANGSQQEIKKSIATVLNRLARSRCLDLVTLKKKSSLVTETKILQPLPIAPGLVLVPLKVRHPKIPGDITIGYVNFHSVVKVSKNHTRPYQSTIRLIGGAEIPIIWTPATVKQHLQQARLTISSAAYDPAIPPELSIHLYHTIKALCQLASLRHSPDQNFVPVP